MNADDLKKLTTESLNELAALLERVAANCREAKIKRI
jgi:hypothetical protein